MNRGLVGLLLLMMVHLESFLENPLEGQRRDERVQRAEEQVVGAHVGGQQNAGALNH